MRTDLCGTLGVDDVGRTVAVCGWVAARREHGEHLAFIDLRDHSGVVQCVVDGAHDLRSEYVIRVTGRVIARGPDQINEAIPTGRIEITDCAVEVLSPAEPPPFRLDGRVETDENIRLRYRYLDLRTERMQRNLRIRSKVNAALRGAMESQGFVEIETPMLVASTPEGARDFVVPSRLRPGSFYALPQSPQLFKQLCMVGGIDRYYQIARCLRDEDLRADRQFEFMQLDAEMAFASQADVLEVISTAVSAAFEAVGHDPIGDIPQMSWHEARDRFGSDKPDTRFGLELLDVSEVFAATGFNAFRAPCVRGIRVPGGAEMTRSRLDDLTDAAKRWGAKGLVWMRVQDATLESPVAKFLTEAEMDDLRVAMAAEAGDLLLLVADSVTVASHVLGLLRLELGRSQVSPGALSVLWVVDFPLFEGIAEDGRPIPAHHPFTMPHPDDLPVLAEVVAGGSTELLLDLRSQAYDLVINGWELGSGSVRIHRRDIQEQIFAVLGIGAEEAQEKFGFLLDAFRYGAPPHAGFAFGIDRLTAILAGEDNIREVIAFPKTQTGTDPLTGAPSELDPAQLAELGLRTLPPRG
jgi:aspartyl-tRNA synthetase